MTPKPSIRLSIVIPAYNEAAIIGVVLDALLLSVDQIDESVEIIVADDASDDGTGDIARGKGVTVINANRRQIAGARNAGAAAAQGDILLFVDADTFVGPDPLRAVVTAIEDGAVGGGCRFTFDDPLPLYARILLPCAVRLYQWFKLASGCFIFCTRDVFDAVGGFDETLFAAEETALSQSIKKHGRFVVLRESVRTSGRKLRTYSVREIFGTLLRAIFTGGRSVKSRDRLDVWYGPRRADGIHRDSSNE